MKRKKKMTKEKEVNGAKNNFSLPTFLYNKYIPKLVLVKNCFVLYLLAMPPRIARQQE